MERAAAGVQKLASQWALGAAKGGNLQGRRTRTLRVKGARSPSAPLGAGEVTPFEGEPAQLDPVVRICWLAVDGNMQLAFGFARSTLQVTTSPGATASRPAARATIFSASVAAIVTSPDTSV